MKLNRITSLAAVVVAVLIVVGQFVSGVKAAPPPQYNASITAKVGTAAGAAVNKGDKPATHAPGSPTDQSPLDITVQGRLTDHSGNPITTPTAMVFNIYNVPSGGSVLLTQNATLTPDLNGLFTYIFIVDTSANWNNVILFDSKLYMGIKVGSDTEMTPRFELTAAPYAMGLVPGAEIIGNFDYGSNIDNGLLNLYNSNNNNQNSAGLFSAGPRGVWGNATSNSGGSSMGGYFTNYNNDAGNSQYGVYGIATHGYGVYGESDGTSSGQNAVGGYFASSDNSTSLNAGVYATGATGVYGFATSSGSSNGYGGFFYNSGGGSGVQDGVLAYGPGSGVVAAGADGVLANSGSASQHASNDGVDAGGTGGSSYGYYTTQPTGDANFSFYGDAHIHGTNIAAASYEVEVRYHGSEPAQIGDILALDGNNETFEGNSVLGVVAATANNANAAVGVLAYRLDTNKVKGVDKTYIDAKATQVKSGDRAYIVVVGQARMKVSGSVNIGDHLAITGDGSIVVTRDGADSIGKVASKPDANGMVTVFINFK